MAEFEAVNGRGDSGDADAPEDVGVEPGDAGLEQTSEEKKDIEDKSRITSSSQTLLNQTEPIYSSCRPENARLSKCSKGWSSLTIVTALW